MNTLDIQFKNGDVLSALELNELVSSINNAINYIKEHEDAWLELNSQNVLHYPLNSINSSGLNAPIKTGMTIVSNENNSWTWREVEGSDLDYTINTPLQAFLWSIGTPTILPNQENLGDWKRTAENKPLDKPLSTLWMTQSTKYTHSSGSVTYDSWSSPVCISGPKGDNGSDSENREWIYVRTNLYPFAGTLPKNIDRGQVSPEGFADGSDTNKDLDDWVPLGWSDRALPALEDQKYVYTSWRDKGQNSWGEFSTPILWSNWGVQGLDGDGVQYLFKRFNHELTAQEKVTEKPDKTLSTTRINPNTKEWEADGWTDDPLGTNPNLQYEYCSIIKYVNGSWKDFSDLTLWSLYDTKGEKGLDAQYIYLKGTAGLSVSENFYSIDSEIKISGGTNNSQRKRGLNIVTINRYTLLVVDSRNYDTWAQAFYTKYPLYTPGENVDTLGITNLVTYLNTLENDVFVAIVSQDAVGWTSELISTLQTFGMSDIPYTDVGNYPFLFLGYKGLEKDKGYTRMRSIESYLDVLELGIYIANGSFSVLDGKAGINAEYYKLYPIKESSEAYLNKSNNTVNKKLDINLLYAIIHIVGDSITKVSDFSNFKLECFRDKKYDNNVVVNVNESDIVKNGGLALTQSGEFLSRNETLEYLEGETTTTVVLFNNTSGEILDRRTIPVVFRTGASFTINEELGQIESVVVGNSGKITQLETSIKETKDSITLSARRTGTDNLIPNSLINETSSEFGLLTEERQVNLVKGKKYTFSANGHINDLASNDRKSLRIYIYRGDNLEGTYLEIKSSTNSTVSTTFECSANGTYYILAYMYPEGGSRLGKVTLNWIKLEEGEEATEYHTDVAQSFADLKVTSDSIVTRVGNAETALRDGNFKITANTEFEGNVAIQGLLTEKTASLKDNNGVAPSLTLLNLGNKDLLISSITVSKERSNDSSIPVVILPTWNDFRISSENEPLVEIKKYRTEGTRLTITNPYNPDYANWSFFEGGSRQASLFDEYGLDLLKHSVLVCSDPRLLSKRLYDSPLVDNKYTLYTYVNSANTSWIDNDGTEHWNEGISEPGYYNVIYSFAPLHHGNLDSLGSDVEARILGNMICNGLRGRMALLLPGLSLELISRKEKITSGDFITDYLYWQILNNHNFKPSKMWFTKNVNGTYENPISNTGWQNGVGFSENDANSTYCSAFFCPPLIGNEYANDSINFSDGTPKDRILKFDLIQRKVFVSLNIGWNLNDYSIKWNA